jgi:hypothetical protein
MVSKRLVTVDRAMVHRAVERARAQLPVEEAGPRRPVGESTGQDEAERMVLRLMLANDPAVRGVALDEGLFTRREHRESYRLLAPVLEALAEGEAPDLGWLLSGEDCGDLGPMLSALALEDPSSLPEDSGDPVRRLQAGAIDRRIAEVRVRIAEAERTPAGVPSALLEELIGLERRRRDLRSPQ